MTDRILEGAGSSIVRSLIETAVPILVAAGRFEEFKTNYQDFITSNPEVKKNPKLLRHASEVIQSAERWAKAFKSPTIGNATNVSVDTSGHKVKHQTNETLPSNGTIVSLPHLENMLRGTANGVAKGAASVVGAVRDAVAAPFDDVLSIIDGLHDAAVTDVGLDPADINEILNGSTAPKTREADPNLQVFLNDFVRAPKHPFIRVFNSSGKRFVVVGTQVGKAKRPGVSFNANCTTRNFRKIKDASEDILVHRDGRPVTLCHETPDGDRYFVWMLHHKPGLELRYWINVNDNGVKSDHPQGNARIVLTDDTQGWRKAR